MFSYPPTFYRTISHSVINDMTVIQQDPPASSASVLAAMDRKKYSSEESSSSFYSKYFQDLIVLSARYEI